MCRALLRRWLQKDFLLMQNWNAEYGKQLPTPMSNSVTEEIRMNSSVHSCRSLFGLVSLLMLIPAIGCKTDYGAFGINSMIPDDVVFFEPGPEFKLANEAAAKRATLEAEANTSTEAAATRNQQ
jgi:hypothetical protein